jgi:hypothetical protein
MADEEEAKLAEESIETVLRREKEALIKENLILAQEAKDLREKMLGMAPVYAPSNRVVPVEKLCRHGKSRQGEGMTGCEALCKNKLCRHKCAEHGMNCLKMVGLNKDKKPIYCPCVGLEW